MAEFSHLHLHTQYSLLDGAIRVGDLFSRISELGMNTVAATDHGNMFGAVDLYKASKKHGVKLIFGCETYIAATDRTDKTNRRSYHLVLLAKNKLGFNNLQYLNSMGYLEGFYYNPRIDKEILRKHSEGLIGMSACLGGEVAQTMLKHGIKEAEEVAKEYKSIFAPGDFYLEMMPNGMAEQDQLNAELRTMGPRLGIPLVATNDCHYVERSDAKAHDILMCIQTGKTVNDENRLKHDSSEFFIKSPAEMVKPFHDCPEALENTVRIAEQCNVELDLGDPKLPSFKVPEGYDLERYLAKMVDEGMDQRFREKTSRGESFDVDEYRARIKFELDIINGMKFPGYFLIVWDFIRWAKEQKIPVGPGRGSGAGSIVAYALRITDIDPLVFKLLFERFLNPERVSMPDFDVDFCMNRREEVIHYVQDKYGRDHVGQIATFHQLKARGVVRDIARVMELPYGEADKLAKLIPEPVAGKTPTIREAIEMEPALKDLFETDSRVRELLDVAASLEGLNRHAGMHAAGVVIGDEPLWNYVPCFRGKNGEIVTQYNMNDVEQAGLVKFDFLGLKTLTVIDTAVKIINLQREGIDEEPFDIDLISMEDDNVYEMIGKGDTTGVFQLESSGFREILKKLKPSNIEDVVAAVALYRPGPLEGGMVDDFIERKHGRQEIVYDHPALEPILRDTYGVIVYQEQVMQIAQVIGDYSLGRADLLRRAMGKKKAEVMVEQKKLFVEGALANKKETVDKKTAEALFDLMAFFAGYGFNRSHSAAYGWVTYQTAFLKKHYPHEFMAGLMSCDQDNTENIVKFIAEARAMHLKVARPDVIESQQDFTVVPAEKVEDKVIRFGLGAVKGVGSGAVESILRSRNEDGPYESMFDFCERVDSQKVNRRVIEALVKAGAYDGIPEGDEPISRARSFAAIEVAMERGAQAQRDRRSGQTSLFGMLEPEKGEGPADEVKYPVVKDWGDKERLQFEKESLGFYISGHPLDRFAGDLKRYANAIALDFVEERKEPGEYSIGGVVSAYRERPTRRGDGKLAFFQLEDAGGQLEVIVFPKTFEKVREVLTSDEPILCKGTVK
ncbi:MAG: DNA polymerase III subunit alpha, partial [Myxococcales bacterium]|nr:DNA polymerase III subunit alpha [Myxococcales bacterium]